MNTTESKLIKNTSINAIDYIKNSSIFSNQRYTWILPLLSKTLNDDLYDHDINYLVDSLLLRKRAENKIIDLSQPALKTGITSDGNSTTNLIKIKSIDKISNIGLLNVEEPINLKNGLNVFYGKNGTGKSTVYLSLCKVLGKNKKIYSNIETENNESFCQITFEDENNNHLTTEWDSDNKNDEFKVMIFDSQISNYIVEHDQKNQFKMAHLKMEYFSFLHELYNKIENRLILELNKLETEYNFIEKKLTEEVPFVLEDDFDRNKKKIKKFAFTKKNKEKLSKLKHRIKILENNNLEPIAKNINNALIEIKSILSVFGELTKKVEGNEKKEDVWKLHYDNYYWEKVNIQIDEYNKIKDAYEKSGENKVSSLIPPEWINIDIWKNFISKSMDFLNSLEKRELQKYSNKTCVYCHQPLQTEASKSLVKAYQELHKEHKEKLDNEARELKKISKEIDKCVVVFEGLPNRNKKIENEFETVCIDEHINYDFENIKSIFLKYKSYITTTQKIEIDNKDINVIKDFFCIYDSFFTKFKTAINKLYEDKADKGNNIERLKSKFKLLQEKKALYENKNIILQYCKINKIKDNLSAKMSDISALKQFTSSLKSIFSKKSTLVEFKKYLYSEYNFFNFTPPEMWNISPTTRDGINKRVYSIGDKRLAEIFSEGEKKIHALSDFFAQCKLVNYKGVFIFDDPVNSLDEDNIEVVANRIIELIKDGNQVIVFTHNLYFLNSIINTQKDKITKIERVNNQINLFKELNIGETQELKVRLNKINSKIKELPANEPERIDEYDIRNIYDLISGYLEDYVEKKLFKNIICRYRPNIRMQTLGDIKTIDTNIIDKVSKLYEKTSRRGSRHSSPGEVKKPKYQELVEDVRYLNNDLKYN